MKRIRVLIIDDSSLARDILSRGLGGDPAIDIVGTAPDVYVARELIVSKKPDVLTLDIEMPRMDGIEFLRKLMPQYPLPVVIVSSLSAPGASVTFEALELGAFDYCLKPSSQFGSRLEEMIVSLREKVKAAAEFDVSEWRRDKGSALRSSGSSRFLSQTTDKIIAVGASTGGTVAISTLLKGIPANTPGMVIVQHMPPKFTAAFAERCNRESQAEVKEAQDGDRILRGRVLIAPGAMQMEVYRSGGYYYVRCREGPKVNGHCPSVGVLFDSVARHVGPNSVGVMLTGMGSDGADGMVNMRKAGARTAAQDEATSVVFGMPREAYVRGGAETLVPLSGMVDHIIRLVDSIGTMAEKRG